MFSTKDNTTIVGSTAAVYPTQTFANALVNTGDNKYKLSKIFFPLDDIPPIQVEITYNSTSNATEPRVWYWIKGGFQPFQLFELRSLFLATPSWRKSLSLVLPNNCFADYNKTNNKKKISVCH